MSTLANIYQKLPMRVKRICSRLRLFKLYNLGIKDRYLEIERNGIIYNIDRYTYVGSRLYNFGVYEPDTTRIIDEYVKPGMTVVDIGASIGAHTLPLAKKVGAGSFVYAFEPSRFLFVDLCNHIDKNGFENIVPVNKALSDKEGLETIRMERLGHLDGSLLDQPYEEVKAVTLDNFVKEHKIKKIDFIKIDTDGFEHRIFLGGIKTLKRDHPILIVEFRKETVRNLIDLLGGIGYKFYDEKTQKRYNLKDLRKLKKVINVLVK